MEVETTTTNTQTIIEEAKEAARSLHERIAHHNDAIAATKKDLSMNIASLKAELDHLEQRLSSSLSSPPRMRLSRSNLPFSGQ